MKKLIIDDSRISYETNEDVTNALNEDANKLNVGGIYRFVDPVTRNPMSDFFKNKVVYRGRLFNMERLYNEVLPTNTETFIANLDRKIKLFSLGSGGTNTNDPSSPNTVGARDYTLKKPEPFFSIPETESLSSELANKYRGEVLSGGYKGYYHKQFESDPTWFINPAENVIYKRHDLLIDTRDVRDKGVNEISLSICTDDFRDIEMFSRSTFPTEYMYNNKVIIVEYYVYV